MQRLATFFLVVTASASVRAQDTVPFVIVQDDGTIEHTAFDTLQHANRIANELLDLYDDSGANTPNVISVWTAFPFDDNVIETRFVPLANDVTGIGLENVFGEGEEVFSILPPLRAMLIHNDVTALAERAEFQRLPSDGFGQYIFLLELSHMWGPEVHLPGSPPERLLGFDFHWSFFMDAGTSPAGGNAWIDNGDGTFTAPVFRPAAVNYSPLDLYLMGLAPMEEVPPFGLLVDVVVPSDALDPFTQASVDAASFPWPGPEPMTVTATRQTLTIDDVITQNGERSPAYGTSPTSFTLGIMLVVSENTEPMEIYEAAQVFAPLANDLALAFERATGGRGALEVLTSSAVLAMPDRIEPEPNDDTDTPEKPASRHGCNGTAASALTVLLALGALRFKVCRWYSPSSQSVASFNLQPQPGYQGQSVQAKRSRRSE